MIRYNIPTEGEARRGVAYNSGNVKYGMVMGDEKYRLRGFVRCRTTSCAALRWGALWRDVWSSQDQSRSLRG
jgi:hypothetical protein